MLEVAPVAAPAAGLERLASAPALAGGAQHVDRQKLADRQQLLKVARANHYSSPSKRGNASEGGPLLLHSVSPTKLMAWQFRRAMVGRSMTLPPMMVLRSGFRDPPQAGLLALGQAESASSSSQDLGNGTVPLYPTADPLLNSARHVNGSSHPVLPTTSQADGSSPLPQTSQADGNSPSQESSSWLTLAQERAKLSGQLESENAQIKSENAQLQCENAQLRHELQEQSKHLTCLERDLSAFHANEQKLQDQAGYVECLEKELVSMRDNEVRLQDLVESACAEILNLRGQIAELQNERGSPQACAQAENAELRRRLAELQGDAPYMQEPTRVQRPVQRRTSAPPTVLNGNYADQVFLQVGGDSCPTSQDPHNLHHLHRTGTEPSIHVDDAGRPRSVSPRPRFVKAFQRNRKAVDEIDEHLLSFMECNSCPFQFKRINRGWYQFWPSSNLVKPRHADAKHVELSIVNGKLMARMEPSSLDPGWNKGRPGAMDRFIAALTKA